MTAFVIPNAISIVTATNTKGHFFASFLSRDAAHDLLMAAWRKSFPCAANASVGHSQGNGYRRDRSNMAINDDEDSNDAQSFISARGNSESRKNRHRRSFSNASQTWIGDEGANGKEGFWTEEDGHTGSRRRGSKKGVKKLLKGNNHDLMKLSCCRVSNHFQYMANLSSVYFAVLTLTILVSM